MSNNAYITSTNRDMAIYLHWNGGRDSVEAFLDYCRMQHFRSPETDSYGYARLCQIIANFFGSDGLSIGIEKYTGERMADFIDNGIYVIENWEIVDRIPISAFAGHEQKQHDHMELLMAINKAQPTSMRLSEEIIRTNAHIPTY